MKAVVKGAVLGAIVGVASPVVLAVGNELLFALKSQGDIAAARICIAERSWSLSRVDIKHYKGCRNGLIDSVPLCLLVGVLGGSLIGALSLVSKGSQNSSSSTPDAAPPQPATPTLLSPVVASKPEPIPQPAAPSQSNLQKPSLPAISPQIADRFQHLKGLDWSTIGKGAVVAVVAAIGVGAVNLLKVGGSSGSGVNPFKPKVQRQYYAVEGYSKAYVKEMDISSSVNPALEAKTSRTDVCISKKDNAISGNQLSDILSRGGRVITQGGQTEQEVFSGYTYDKAFNIYVTCFYIPYIIEE